jgi:hypothetical protein
METKICCKCNNEKPIEEFSWKNKNLNLRRARCKTCMREQDNGKYAIDEIRRKKIRETANTKVKWNREYIQRIKKIFNCRKCGEKRWYVLDFHHLGSKDIEISNLLHSSYSIQRIKDEIRKCIILCANCHREEHFLNK